MNIRFNGLLLLGAVIAAACAIGIMMVGSPIAQKLINADAARLTAFNQIKNSIESYYHRNRFLPSSLTDLAKNNTYYSLDLTDPETKKQYEYQIVTSMSYKLCATFSTDSDEVKKQHSEYNKYSFANPYGVYFSEYQHKKGYDCMTYTVSPLFLQPLGGITPSPHISNESDKARIRDMWSIHNGVDRYYGTNKKFPVLLKDLKAFDPSISIIDPITKVEYAYVPHDAEKTYSICANYDTESGIPYGVGSSPDSHTKGYYCSLFTTGYVVTPTPESSNGVVPLKQ